MYSIFRLSFNIILLQVNIIMQTPIDLDPERIADIKI